MIEKVLLSLVPMAMLKLKAIRLQDKRELASFAADVCTAYKGGDRETFDKLLTLLVFPDNLKQQIVEALWTDENQT